jgi:hypothetical protein
MQDSISEELKRLDELTKIIHQFTHLQVQRDHLTFRKTLERTLNKRSIS